MPPLHWYCWRYPPASPFPSRIHQLTNWWPNDDLEAKDTYSIGRNEIEGFWGDFGLPIGLKGFFGGFSASMVFLGCFGFLGLYFLPYCVFFWSHAETVFPHLGYYLFFVIIMLLWKPNNVDNSGLYFVHSNKTPKQSEMVLGGRVDAELGGFRSAVFQCLPLSGTGYQKNREAFQNVNIFLWDQVVCPNCCDKIQLVWTGWNCAPSTQTDIANVVFSLHSIYLSKSAIIKSIVYFCYFKWDYFPHLLLHG